MKTFLDFYVESMLMRGMKANDNEPSETILACHQNLKKGLFANYV